MSVKRIRIEVFGNESYRKFHVTAQVSAEKQRAGFLGGNRHDPFLNISFGEEKTELSEDTKATIMRFYDIDGVASVGLDTNEVGLTKASAYEWSDIEDDIVEAIKLLVGWQDDQDVTVDWLFYGRVRIEPITSEEFWAEIDRQRAEEERYSRMYDRF